MDHLEESLHNEANEEIDNNEVGQSSGRTNTHTTSGDSLNGVWLRQNEDSSIGTNFFSGDQSYIVSKKVRSMGSFDNIKRCGILSVALAKNLQQDMRSAASLSRLRSIGATYEEIEEKPEAVEVDLEQIV